MPTECADVPTLIQQGHYAEALARVAECISAGSGDPSTLRYWAGCCLEADTAGDKEAALACYREAARDHSDPARRARSLYRAGSLLMGAQRWDEAAHTFAELLSEIGEAGTLLDEQRDALYWHAGCLEASGRYLEALAEYGLCSSRDSRIAPEALYRQIVCLDRIGKFEEALATCDAFGELPPGDLDPARHEELQVAVARERELLAGCLGEDPPAPRAGRST